MIRQEVIKKLDSLYPDNPIYGEEVPQNFEDGSFYVKVLSGSQKNSKVNKRYKRINCMDIHYFGSTNKECELKANELYENMEYLLNNYSKGINMHHEVIDRVLHFFVDYKVNLTQIKEEVPKMKDLEVKESGK